LGSFGALTGIGTKQDPRDPIINVFGGKPSGTAINGVSKGEQAKIVEVPVIDPCVEAYGHPC